VICAVGAQELAMFLSDELKLEKQSAWNQLPKLHGFQLISTSGPAVVLTRKYYHEMYERFFVSSYCCCIIVLLELLNNQY